MQQIRSELEHPQGRTSVDDSQKLAFFEKILLECRNNRELMELASDGTRPVDLRTVAIWTVGMLGAKMAIRPLIELLEDPDGQISYSAGWCLCQLGYGKFAARILRILSESPRALAREGAAWAFWKSRYNLASIPLQVAATTDSEESVRVAATHALISYPSKKTFRALVTALGDSSARVRRMATFAISSLGARKGAELSLTALRGLTKDKTTFKDGETMSNEANEAIYVIRKHMKERRSLKTSSR